MMTEIDKLMRHAVERYGRDRHYEIRFGASSPIVLVTWSDGTAIAELWLSNSEIREEVFAF